jgi:hypothetical protein
MSKANSEMIAEEEAGRRPKTDMTLNSAFHLQDYYKTFKRDADQSLTMLDMQGANRDLRREYQSTDRETATLKIPNAGRIKLLQQQESTTMSSIADGGDNGDSSM